MSNVMRDRLIAILKSWELAVERDGRASAGGRDLGYDSVETVLNAILEEMGKHTASMARAGEEAVDDSIDETSDSHSSYAVWDNTNVALSVWRAMLREILTPSTSGQITPQSCQMA